METSPLFCSANKCTGFYFDRDLRHKRVKVFINYGKQKPALTYFWPVLSFLVLKNASKSNVAWYFQGV